MLLEKLPYQFPRRIFYHFSQQPFCFLLESALNEAGRGRYSFFGHNPFLVFKSKGERIEIFREGEREIIKGDPFENLRELINEFKVEEQLTPSLPPLKGGAVGYFAYDMGFLLEEIPLLSRDDLGLPDCILGFYDLVLCFDHFRRECWLISTGFPERGRARKIRAIKRAEEFKKTLLSPSWIPSPPSFSFPLSFGSNFEKEKYLKAVKKAVEYIKAGDIFQVNLSQRFELDFPLPPFPLYETLTRINPAPFASFLRFPEVSVVSSSPERFLFLQGKTLQTRPIKGTRPRGKTPKEDRKMAQELLQSEKDKAELIMIVDLERNDLGKVCEYGSVRVRELRRLETHPTVFHTVSTVEGRIKKEVDRIDILKACFPGGSITGAPKVRAMEIIEELEPTRRSIYTGSIGYLSFSGEMDLNIVIRTILIKENKAYFQVGGGIVVDSDPEREYQETLDKGKALFESLQREYEKIYLAERETVG